jgi:hypothetical protein
MRRAKNGSEKPIFRSLVALLREYLTSRSDQHAALFVGSIVQIRELRLRASASIATCRNLSGRSEPLGSSCALARERDSPALVQFPGAHDIASVLHLIYNRPE